MCLYIRLYLWPSRGLLCLMKRIEWHPHPGPQTKYFQSKAFELLYGGSKGGGKSECLVIDGLRQIHKKGYNGMLLRRTIPELEIADSLIPRSQRFYRFKQGIYRDQKKIWTFPNNSHISFGHMQGRMDHFRYSGGQYPVLLFDELQSFEEEPYLYMFGMCRSDNPEISCYIRGGANPGAEWIYNRWRPWLDPNHPNPARDGELRYFATEGDKDVEVEKGYKGSWSRSFIRASYKDNPSLDQDYINRLNALPYVLRMQLRDGDWAIRPGSGKIINREWYLDKRVKYFPAGSRKVRYWDLAATEKKQKTHDPDWTATCLACLHEGKLFTQIERYRYSWRNVKKLLRQKAEEDGPDVSIGIEQEGGASGKGISEDLIELLQGYHVIPYRPVGDKLTRALPWTAQAEAGNHYIVESNVTTTGEILKEFHNFPKGSHDDMVDATSGAYTMTLTWSGSSLLERFSSKPTGETGTKEAGSLLGRFT